MRVLVVSEVIHPGGAEIFALRLAHGLRQQGHQVFLLVFYADRLDQQLVEQFCPGVPVYTPGRYPKIVRLLDRIPFKLGIDLSLFNAFCCLRLLALMWSLKIDLVHSHLFRCDWLAVRAAGWLRVPVVTTMHGDYDHFRKAFASRSKGETPLNFPRKASAVLSQIRGVACITEEQVEELVSGFKAQPSKLRKIYNGFSPPQLSHAELADPRASLGIAKDSLVFGMVGRGIREKGWREAIRAFLSLPRREGVHLILVGGGPFLDALSTEYRSVPGLHFAGIAKQPLQWMRIFDVGILPSYTECLPTVIIEYLHCGLPTIATDVGEVRRMLNHAGVSAGTVIPAGDSAQITQALAEAMGRYIDQPELRLEHASHTQACFSQFEMPRCVKAYEDLYSAALH